VFAAVVCAVGLIVSLSPAVAAPGQVSPRANPRAALPHRGAIKNPDFFLDATNRS
jgi:hypothetical protein